MNLFKNNKKNRRKPASFINGVALLVWCWAAFIFFGFLASAFAQETSEPEGKVWMSVEHFLEKIERFPDLFKDNEEKVAKEGDKAEEKGGTKKAEAETEGKAEQQKPDEGQNIQTKSVLSLPLLPGLSAKYDLYVNSTAEDDNKEEYQESKFFGTPSRKIDPPMMPSVSEKTESVGKEEDEDPFLLKKKLNIRFAKIPNAQFASPSLSPVVKSKDERNLAEAKKEIGKTNQQDKQQPLTCDDPLTAYRKRQLAAIEIDRQTLKALQEAIAELGLGNKIDFSNGAIGAKENLKPEEKASPADSGKQKNKK